jgi:hypothetical protein
MEKCTSIFFILRRIAYVEVNKKIKTTPKKLQLIVDFLKREPIDNFILESYVSPLKQKEITLPLTMNEKAIKSFKEITSEYPDLYKAGQAGQTKFNLIYAIGQLLTDIATLFNIYSLQEKDIVSMDKIFKIWGSQKDMNGRALSHKYNKKTNLETKKSLLLKLEKSINILKNEIIPDLK